MVGNTVFGMSHSNGIHNFWVLPSTKSRSHVKCRYCNTDVSIQSMGVSGLESHARGKKHKELVAAARSTPPIIPLRLPVTTVTTSEANVSSVTSPSTPSVAQDERSSSNTMASFVGTKKHNDSVMQSEILWTIHTVVCNNSFSSNNDVGDVFKRIFFDSKIAKGFSLAETKSKYVLEHGIQLHFQKLLMNKVSQNSVSGWFVVCFDETLNSHLQEKQLDMYIRFWDRETVLTRYIHSEFLGKARAKDLVDCFEVLDGIQSLENMLQVSMDGPSVNLAAHRQIEERSQSKYGHGLLDMGTCGLHQVHNALKAAMDPKDIEDTFKIQQFLKALYRLFQDTPARRAEYTKVTGSAEFPQSFATHRWADNKRATVRGVDMLPHLRKFCRAVEARKNGINKITSHSYKVVRDFVMQDKFAEVKLEFFISLCGKIEPFLVTFQTDRPMAPFLIKELNDIVLDVARRFLHSKYCTDRKNKPLEQLEIRKTDVYRSAHNINLGNAANRIIDQMLESGSITEDDYDAFKNVCREACIRFLDKLISRSPAQHTLALNMDCLDPKLIATKPIKAVAHFRNSLNCVLDAYLMKPREVDTAVCQFQSFVDAHTNNSEFLNFNFRLKDHRVDTLFYKAMYDNKELMNAWDVVVKLLLLSHGQASVERGFSINKNASIVNQSEDSLVARRVVRDHVNYVGGINKIEVTDDFIQVCRYARQKYTDKLETNKRNKAAEKKETRKDALQKEIEEQKKKIKVNMEIGEFWDSQMQKQLKLVTDPDKAIVANPRLALEKVAEFNVHVKTKAEELVILNEELASLQLKYKNV